jgi:hypothetical protein
MPTRAMRRTVAVVAMLALAAGCQPEAGRNASSGATQPQGAKIERNRESTSPRAAVAPASGSPALVFAEPPAEELAGGEVVETTWDAISMQGQRIGYARTIVAKVRDDGRELVRTSAFFRLVVSREGQNSEQTMQVRSWDTPGGEFVRFESRMASGPTEMVVLGSVQDGQLTLEQSTLGQKQTSKTPWPAGTEGPFAVEQSLRRQPMKAGEKRTIRCLLAPLNVPGEVALEGLAEEMVELPFGPQKLLKMRAVMTAGQFKIEELRWTDSHGEVHKSLLPSLRQEAVRTTKEVALAPASGGPLDLMSTSIVPLSGNRAPLPGSKRAVYRARVESGPIAGVFVDCPSQRVRKVDEQTAELTVIAVRPAHTVTGPPAAPPTDADRAANGIIQSDDRLITQMAAQVAAKETDPWKIACALELFVQATVQNKNYSQAFATAADVARTLEGDCTEHAVLLAALCRAQKIPARVAAGLIYYPPKKGFAYHMWTEVWIDDRWLPLDGTLGLGGIGADHIKLTDSNLSGGSPLSDLLSIVQVFGRLKLELVEIEQ